MFHQVNTFFQSMMTLSYDRKLLDSTHHIGYIVLRAITKKSFFFAGSQKRVIQAYPYMRHLSHDFKQAQPKYWAIIVGSTMREGDAFFNRFLLLYIFLLSFFFFLLFSFLLCSFSSFFVFVFFSVLVLLFLFSQLAELF